VIASIEVPRLTTEAGLLARKSRPEKAEALPRPGRSPERASAEAKGGAAWTDGANPDVAAPADAFRVRPPQGRPRPDFADGRNPAGRSVSTDSPPGADRGEVFRSHPIGPLV